MRRITLKKRWNERVRPPEPAGSLAFCAPPWTGGEKEIANAC